MNQQSNLTREQQTELLIRLEKLKEFRRHNKFLLYYPDKDEILDPTTPSLNYYSRHKYKKQLEFFKAGKEYNYRVFLAGNQTGKTATGCYEITAHATGDYPDWWEGYRFDHALDIWVCGFSKEKVRDILQKDLLGERGNIGTGMLPKSKIGRVTWRQGLADTADTIEIAHVSGGTSRITFKFYEGGFEAFQGSKVDIVWCDEEPPVNIYTECAVRVFHRKGLLLLTETPEKGLSETICSIFPNGIFHPGVEGDTYVVMASWDDVPHLDEESKRRLLEKIPPQFRDAKTKGIPFMGAGLIFPVPEEQFVIEPRELPQWWPRAYGMDVGWNRTAVIWGAYDKESDTWYLYSEHYRSQAEPSIHADAIKARGSWIPGVIDPASRGRGQRDGVQLFREYSDLGLDLTFANNAVEPGLLKMWQMLSTGRIKVFNTLQNWLSEIRMYRRNDKGEIPRHCADHLMDATRYLIMTGNGVCTIEPDFEEAQYKDASYNFSGRNNITGY